jgi:hypothetical protein
MTDHLSGELKAMVQVESALSGLQEEEVARVMQWASSRFKFSTAASPKGGSRTVGEASAESSSGSSTEYSDIATFYDAASPDTDADKALVAAYWFQVYENSGEIESQTVNTALKNLGHGIGNITRAFTALKEAKPALLVQTRKEGSAQQARKKFKVTAEGKKAVERMLNGGGAAA